MLIFNLCEALDGIHNNTNWSWAKSFRGVFPMIFSMQKMLCVMWNVALDCDIVWTVSHSLASGSSPICDVDDPIPMMLTTSYASLIFLRNCLMSSNSSCIMSLWCTTFSKSLDVRSWTIWAIISASSSVIVYSRIVLCTFIFLCAPPVWIVCLLVRPSSYGSGLGVVPYTASACFCYFWGTCVLFFFPFWVPTLDVPPFIYFGLTYPVLGFLGTRTSWGCVPSFFASSMFVCSCLTSSSYTLPGMYGVRNGILQSSSQYLIVISMFSSMMQ